jgi:signal transduction histidine kinase
MAEAKQPALGKRTLEILGTAAAYYAVGRLSLLLAIPPGYATAVWPAAGLALAGMLVFRGRVWPGVLIGHFFVNLFTSFDSSSTLSMLQSGSLALCIAVGGTLQATLGAALVRRFVGFPTRLDLEKEVTFFLFLAGPVSCLAGASVGIASLTFFGVLEPAAAPFNWFTWWVGDAIGVILVAPVAAIWAAGRDEVPLKRQLYVTIPLVLMLVLAIAFFIIASGLEEVALRDSGPRAHGWLAWAFLTVGLLFTALMSALLILVTGRTTAVQRLVNLRTKELQALNKELESFSYSVAHDLRSPLTGIFASSLMLAESLNPRLDERNRILLEQMVNGTQRMTALIEDLLKLSRLSRAPLQIEPVNLSDIARAVMVELSKRDPQRTVQLQITEGVTASCDNGLMRAALENMLCNAWKFTSKTTDAKISFLREPSPDGEIYCVRDNGAGFDMKKADKLFAPFQRLHPAPEFEGTGIGLATVQRIITRHGGRIWAQATPNEGASFFFTLSAKSSSSVP